MKKLLLSLFLIFCLASNCFAETALITQDTGSGAGWGIGTSVDPFQLGEAQSFQLTSSFELTAIKLNMAANTGSPTGDITLRIETNNGGIPSGTLANANLTKTFTPVASNWNTVTFDVSAVLSANTLYWIVLSVGAQTPGNYYNILTTTPSAYADGNLAYNQAGSWTAYANYDFTFEVWGNLITETVRPQLIFING